ncbi:transmembrane E3 ubiquitin-protein ligase FLY2-like [Silene latifolia]|uniref:transmembrane E3 ubiquitin-protein ligase FLY2-like n=1 Tax=Silene latifolia TaxID=37657 RepID=UPI003D787CCF
MGTRRSKAMKLGFVFRGFLAMLLAFALLSPASSLRPLKEQSRSWGDEWLFVKKEDNNIGPFSSWNISGTYRGNWKFTESANISARFPDFKKSEGSSIVELMSTPTKITGVHYVQGVIVFHDVFDNNRESGGAQIRVEGVYIWPFRQLRMVANSGKDGELGLEEDYFLSNPYHLLGVFSSQVFQESPRVWRKKKSQVQDIEKHCNIEIAAQVSRIPSLQSDGEHDRYHLEGLMESPSADEDGDCFSPLLLNATSVNIEVYYNKAVNYTLMVTFVSFLQVLLLIRQMEHSNTQSGAAKVSILMIGQQAIMDAYLCLLHLTAGILVESLFNAFATAAFFKFVVFSIFEMRYLLAIWKASRPANSGEGWGAMRRELSVLYSRFYGILLGGILVMYEFHSYLRPILLLMYSFWIPQIVTNIIRDSRKPLHPHYILGMTITRLAIPLYVFGCPNNFMRIQPDKTWCVCLCTFMGFQSLVLLVQHYFGSRCFIPRQILPEKYSYYRRFDQDSNRTTDCVICMAAIDLSQRSGDCMVTPCDHFFHSGCLQRWMDIKMECPTCRRSLPPA